MVDGAIHRVVLFQLPHKKSNDSRAIELAREKKGLTQKCGTVFILNRRCVARIRHNEKGETFSG